MTDAPKPVVFPDDYVSVTLEQHVRKLYDEGKRSGDKEFQDLFVSFTEAKIRALVAAYLAEKGKS